jgi:tRNA(fMet)-specific endonuclease VapC
MKYMLDTNTCIYILNNRPAQVAQKFEEHKSNRILLSSIVVTELRYGAEKSQTPEANRLRLEEFITGFLLEPFSIEAGMQAGIIRSILEKQGTPIGHYDYLIAAHALEVGATLVTNNLKEFKRVKGLKLENWFA